MTGEEAINMLKSKMDGHTDTSYEWAETVRMAIKALEQEPKTGHWIECEDEVKCFCSECKEISDYPTKFCPNCGAKIVEPQENCDTCKHKDDGWDSEQCDGCCGANSKWSGEIYPGEFEAMEHNGRMDALESEEQA